MEIRLGTRLDKISIGQGTNLIRIYVPGHHSRVLYQ